MNCCFINPLTNDCSVLKVKKCEGCKWEKTQEEYNAGRDRAEKILKEKGLEASIEYRDGGQYVTTKTCENGN